jgi:hypothetical protein
MSRLATRRLCSRLPQPVRHYLARLWLACPTKEQLRDYEFKLAESSDEYVAALKLVQLAYVRMGYAKPNTSGLRLTPYHLVPTTSIIVVMHRGDVVATASVVRDGSCGLPSDSLANFDTFREAGESLAEISCLAVDPAHRGGRLLFGLFKFIHNFSVCEADVRRLVISVHPRHYDLYVGIFLFERLSCKTPIAHAFANGAPAVPLTLNLQEFRSQLKHIYGRRADKSNLAKFFSMDTGAIVSSRAHNFYASEGINSSLGISSAIKAKIFESTNLQGENWRGV